jgi:hypothetical protein
MRMIGIALLLVWFILKFGLHKGGYVHILLVGAIAVLLLHLLAYRKTQYHKVSADNE